MSKGPSRAPKTSRFTATIAGPDMDFIVGLPRTQKGNNSIWVIVDRQTKVAHFIPVKMTYSGDKLEDLYINNILRLHGVPSRIVSD